MKKQEREEILRHGIGLQRQHKFAEAEYCYQQVLRAAPKDPDANNLMGTPAAICGAFRPLESSAWRSGT